LPPLPTTGDRAWNSQRILAVTRSSSPDFDAFHQNRWSPNKVDSVCAKDTDFSLPLSAGLHENYQGKTSSTAVTWPLIGFLEKKHFPMHLVSPAVPEPGGGGLDHRIGAPRLDTFVL